MMKTADSESSGGGVKLLIALVLFGVGQNSSAQVPSWGVDSFHAPADPHWRPIAVIDVNAAFDPWRSWSINSIVSSSQRKRS